MTRLAVVVCSFGVFSRAFGAGAALDSELTLPPGFEARVFADELGNARHIVATDDGRVYVALQSKRDGNSLVALRDTDGDCQADEIAYFAPYSGAGTGLALHDGYLYYTNTTTVFRQKLEPGELVPTSPRETVVSGFPNQSSHNVKTIAIDPSGNLYVNVGAPSNSCQESDRARKSPGRQPCPELERQAGIWKFAADEPNQNQLEGTRFASGLRNCVALDWDTESGALYVVSHGRDQLDTSWPDFFDAQENAELPAEEMHRLTQGSDAGWPYTYWDGLVNQRKIAPEYGGNGTATAEPGKYQDPVFAFPAHWAPNDLVFARTRTFPEHYQRGAFVAFHGSWNRSPLPQGGYNVVFVPFTGNNPSGGYEVFANNFARGSLTPGGARHRPCGLAFDAAGRLLIADSVRGRIWLVSYVGERRLPDDALMQEGKELYAAQCATCHQTDGSGVPNLVAPLPGSPLIDGPSAHLVGAIVGGSQFLATLPRETSFSNTMPPYPDLTDRQVWALTSYLRKTFGGDKVPRPTAEQVADLRAAVKAQLDL